MPISADLGPKLEAVVNDLVANGRYNSKSEVLRQGVRVLQEYEAALAEFYAGLEKGLDDIDASRTYPAISIASFAGQRRTVSRQPQRLSASFKTPAPSWQHFRSAIRCERSHAVVRCAVGPWDGTISTTKLAVLA